jgi:hypothetical protein
MCMSVKKASLEPGRTPTREPLLSGLGCRSPLLLLSKVWGRSDSIPQTVSSCRKACHFSCQSNAKSILYNWWLYGDIECPGTYLNGEFPPRLLIQFVEVSCLVFYDVDESASEESLRLKIYIGLTQPWSLALSPKPSWRRPGLAPSILQVTCLPSLW